MKLTTRKTFSLLAATALLTVPALTLSTTSASADPVGPPTPRSLVGVGSDTTDPVMNGLADAILVDGLKVLGSFDARGGAFQSRPPVAPATTCDYASNEPTGANGAGIRANGSGAGRSRFLETLTVGNERFGCLDFFRSSALNLAAAPVSLTYVPFAVDGLTYAVRSDGVISKQLTRDDLIAIYTCDPDTTDLYAPLLPQSGSGTRGSWLTFLGLSETTFGDCVEDTVVDPGTGATVSVQEHDGRALFDKKAIVPFSSAQWASQSVGTIEDRRGSAVLGGIGGAPALAVNAGSEGTRLVYNGIATSRVGGTSAADQLLNDVFVGSDSAICDAVDVIGNFGLAPAENCGSTSLVTG